MSTPPRHPGQLPSGRHGIPRAVIAEHQRRRLLAAARAVAVEEGYEAASVTAICTRAGVSRKTFYDHFVDRAECVIAALAADGRHAIPTGIAALDADGWRLVRRVREFPPADRAGSNHDPEGVATSGR